MRLPTPPFFSHAPRMRILLVEDDHNLRAFLRKAFREEGYTVDQAAAGTEGLAAVLGEGTTFTVWLPTA